MSAVQHMSVKLDLSGFYYTKFTQRRPKESLLDFVMRVDKDFDDMNQRSAFFREYYKHLK